MSEFRKAPYCRSCQHYFVTWDPQMPYGCRIFGIKGLEMPSLLVRRASGDECQSHEERQKSSPRPGKPL